MIRPVVLGLVLALGLGDVAMASTPTAWRVDPQRSTIAFRVDAAGAALDARFGVWRADILFDPQNLSGSRLEVTVSTGSARSGQADPDEMMPTADVFDVRRFPTARFTSRRFTARGGNRYDVAGALTIRGVTRQVVVPMDIVLRGDTARASGQMVVDRSQFSVGGRSWELNDLVGQRVTVSISVVASRRP